MAKFLAWVPSSLWACGKERGGKTRSPRPDLFCPRVLVFCLLFSVRLRFSFPALLALVSADVSAVDGVAFFESKVRPLLVKHCYDCHSQESGKRKGGLLLDSKEGWQIGGDAGAAVIPGNPGNSLLMHSVSYQDDKLQMPPKSKLTPQDVRILEQWISMGAPDPREAALSDVVKKKTIDFEAARQGWAFRPLQKTPPPAVKNKAWPRKDLDAFILAELEAKGLTPAADADRRTLMRRLSYDLTGLPPSSDLSATSDLSDYVDKFLNSPQFGEKWGRYWLDLVRYADSNGGDRNYTFYQAWRYRNYVIDAFNNDKSFYEFIREQLAGDLMPAKTPDQRRSQMIASTFLALGPKMLTERDKEKLHLDTVDEQIDTRLPRSHDRLRTLPRSQVRSLQPAGLLRARRVLPLHGSRHGHAQRLRECGELGGAGAAAA
jgi:hypothetical protein